MSDSEVTVLPDGSACAVASFPLPENHWIYGDQSCEVEVYEGSMYEPPPMPFRMGTSNPQRAEMADMVRQAAKYAVRASTMNGKQSDFDPDALVQNMVVGLLGYFTEDGLSSDDWWANPPED